MSLRARSLAVNRHKLLYIASLPHSGSTVTSLILGQQPQIIGLGGIDRAVSLLADEPEKAANEYCSCGHKVLECEYWSKVLATADAVKGAGQQQRYGLALSVFQNVFGPDVWAVDSSKHAEPIAALSHFSEIDLRALHLCRDYRSAIVSSVDLKRTRKNVLRPGWMIGFEAGLRWHRGNSKIRSILVENQIPFLGIGYEELCLGLPHFCNELGAFLNTGTKEIPATIAGSRSHLFIGNAMRRQKHKEALMYDYRWFSRTDWMSASLLMPWLAKGNRDWVYGNGFSKVFGHESGNKWNPSKPD
ncbi:MAG: hypothetical protein WCG66_01145 [bacterium]